MRFNRALYFFISLCALAGSSTYADSLSIKTESRAECNHLCSDLIFDCNSGVWTSTGWCIISTDQAPTVNSGLAIKTPTDRECQELLGFWRQDGWCIIGEIDSTLSGKWNWNVTCPNGVTANGNFTILSVQPNGSFKGKLQHGSTVNPIYGREAQNQLWFKRELNPHRVQKWTTKSLSSTRMTGSLTDPTYQTCNFAAKHQ